ncbi:hypothetical protein ABH917_001523 [Thermobifida halotolerans]
MAELPGILIDLLADEVVHLEGWRLELIEGDLD